MIVLVHADTADIATNISLQISHFVPAHNVGTAKQKPPLSGRLVHGPWYVVHYRCSARYRSASSAAMQPVPAAEIAWR